MKQHTAPTHEIPATNWLLHRLLRGVMLAGLLLIGPIVLYLLLALVLGMLSSHRAYQRQEGDILIYLETNGVHTDLVLPARSHQIDWTRWFAPTHTRSGRPPVASSAISIGWGDRQFYLGTPNWSDLTATTALYALSGLDSTLLHVSWGAMPAHASPQRVALRLSPQNYQRLAAFITQSIRRDAQGQAIWLSGQSYGDTDSFYEATGHYSVIVTCNEWVRKALDAAGVRVPWWSPFDKALFWQLQR
ncbi:TIGR02117 family protein [Silvimonas iriomotensis]|uniref:TIGR02117 family protein n=1 Tax=Silvimonas iriomotensis TaxID=449662 RepID=A0ABQ2PFU8_9NEIS|nr:TIGR02117 family protein [Silvimonas iriomotensis]GGP24114.1 hypothetical protein GCM10010970_41140 [Silvimonas iriomotensis]